MTIFLHLENPTPGRYLQLLRFTVTPETREVVTFFRFQKPTRATAFGALETVQEEFSREQELKYRLYSTFAKGQFYPPAMIRRLQRTGCTVILPHPKPSLERKLLRSGIRIGLQQKPPRYTPETAEGFEAWLHDPEAAVEPAYTNLLSAFALKIPSPDCRRSSCFTRYFYLDAQDTLYLCPHEQSHRTRLGKLSDATNALELFAGEAPMQLLQAAVSRREGCTNCSRFSLCQGGCPLSQPDCDSYVRTAEVIEATLKSLTDLQGLNPIATRLLLHAAAFRNPAD